MLVAAIAANVVVNLRYPELADRFPFIGVAVWVVILVSAPLRRPDWELLGEAGRGAVFLLSLVLAASMMPVESLPAASWQTTFGLGFVSAVFDNIPLTKLALGPGRLRLGRARLRRGLRRLDDLVWIVCRASRSPTSTRKRDRSGPGSARDGTSPSPT